MNTMITTNTNTNNNTTTKENKEMNIQDMKKIIDDNNAGGYATAWAPRGEETWARIYIDITKIGIADVDTYKTGNVCYASWMGNRVPNIDGGIIKGTKIYVDSRKGLVIYCGSLKVTERMNYRYDYIETIKNNKLIKRIVDAVIR